MSELLWLRLSLMFDFVLFAWWSAQMFGAVLNSRKAYFGVTVFGLTVQIATIAMDTYSILMLTIWKAAK